MSGKYPIRYSWRLGTRTIMGTDFPIENLVYRVGPRLWVLAVAVCNGIAEGELVFTTRREAVATARATWANGS